MPILRWPEMRFCQHAKQQTRREHPECSGHSCHKNARGNKSKHDCQQIDRERVHIRCVTDCKLLEEHRKAWTEFASPSSGHEISVIRGRRLVEVETSWIL